MVARESIFRFFSVEIPNVEAIVLPMSKLPEFLVRKLSVPFDSLPLPAKKKTINKQTNNNKIKYNKTGDFNPKRTLSS